MTEEERLALAFKRLFHVLTTGKRAPHEFGDTALYGAEVHVLEIIGKNPGITATDIVNDMQVTKGAVSQIVSKLRRKELVQNAPKAGNIRIHELYVTEKGMEVLLHHDEYEKEIMLKMRAALQKCRPEDIPIFTSIVNTLADFAKKQSEWNSLTAKQPGEVYRGPRDYQSPGSQGCGHTAWGFRKDEMVKEESFDKDLAFWQRMAPSYDRHVKRLGKSQEQVIHHLRELLQGAERILDVGTGTGNIALALAEVVQEVDGVDPSPLMLQEARVKAEAQNLQNVRFWEQDACELKFPDGTFEAVIISHVLHIIDRPDLALSEAKRVLKNGGLLITPTYCHGLSRILSFIARNFLKQPVHFRFVPEDVVQLVRSSGFEVLRCEVLQDKIPVAFVVARLS